MPEMNNEDMGFMVELSDQEIHTLYYAVSEAIRVWPGSPARPPEEQEQLRNMKMSLFSMTLDMAWERSEGDSPR